MDVQALQASNSRLVGLIEKHNTVIACNQFLGCKILKLIDKAIWLYDRKYFKNFRTIPLPYFFFCYQHDSFCQLFLFARVDGGRYLNRNSNSMTKFRQRWWQIYVGKEFCQRNNRQRNSSRIPIESSMNTKTIWFLRIRGSYFKKYANSNILRSFFRFLLLPIWRLETEL